jgi:hypothetical protein
VGPTKDQPCKWNSFGPREFRSFFVRFMKTAYVKPNVSGMFTSPSYHNFSRDSNRRRSLIAVPLIETSPDQKKKGKRPRILSIRHKSGAYKIEFVKLTFKLIRHTTERDLLTWYTTENLASYLVYQFTKPALQRVERPSKQDATRATADVNPLHKPTLLPITLTW